jgi:peptide/nickel transport system ATP-binding protein
MDSMHAGSLKGESLAKLFPGRRRDKTASPILHQVSFLVRRGETLGIMGRSGSGKTTLGLIAAGLEPPSSGRLLLDGRPVDGMNRMEMKEFRRRVQMVFQNPEASLNPGKTIERALGEVLALMRIPKPERGPRILQALQEVGLSGEFACRLPGQLSGGQNQRVVLARALLVGPDFLVLDEPAAALDISERARLLHLLRGLQAERGLGLLFFSHDTDSVRFLAHRAARLENGRLITGAQPGERLPGSGVDFPNPG